MPAKDSAPHYMKMRESSYLESEVIESVTNPDQALA
jgi:hypothetical protein